MNKFRHLVESKFKELGYEYALIRFSGKHRVYLLVKGFEKFKLVISSSPTSAEQAICRIARDIQRRESEKRIV